MKSSVLLASLLALSFAGQGFAEDQSKPAAVVIAPSAVAAAPAVVAPAVAGGAAFGALSTGAVVGIAAATVAVVAVAVTAGGGDSHHSGTTGTHH